MPRNIRQLTNFSSGVLSPKLHGRVDLQPYAQGAAQCENFVVQPQGGITRRPASVQVAALPNYTRLVPFVFGSGDAQVLGFGDKTLSFFTKGAPVLAFRGKNAASTAEVRWARFDADAQGSVGPYSIPTPYGLGEVEFLRFAQLGDVFYIASPYSPPHKLHRVAGTEDKHKKLYQWQLFALQLKDGPYQAVNIDLNNHAHVKDKGEFILTLSTPTTPSPPADLAILAEAPAFPALPAVPSTETADAVVEFAKKISFLSSRDDYGEGGSSDFLGRPPGDYIAGPIKRAIEDVGGLPKKIVGGVESVFKKIGKKLGL